MGGQARHQHTTCRHVPRAWCPVGRSCWPSHRLLLSERASGTRANRGASKAACAAAAPSAHWRLGCQVRRDASIARTGIPLTPRGQCSADAPCRATNALRNFWETQKQVQQRHGGTARPSSMRRRRRRQSLHFAVAAPRACNTQTHTYLPT